MNRLSEIRKFRNLTQKQLSQICKINIRQIQKIESEEYKLENITAKNFLAISKALNIDPYDLIKPSE